MSYKILAINPGSTSTKFSVYEDTKEVFCLNVQHEVEELNVYKQISDQQYYRKDIVLNTLVENNIDIHEMDAVIGRGGLIRPVASGIYKVNDRMRKDLRNAFNGEHASNLGGLIAYEVAKQVGEIDAFIADPVVVDEMTPMAKITGHPLFEKKSIFHALNQKAVARRYARENGKKYADLNLIVCHMGGGITVGAHAGGKVVDVNNGFDGAGPFTPERSGTLPAGDLIKLCLSLDYGKANLKQILTGGGGLMAHLGTSDFKEVMEKVNLGDPKAKLIFDAFIYHLAKEIGSLSAVLKGKIDAIILTGGIAHNETVIGELKNYVGFMAPFTIYPGENELESLAMNALRVLKGEEEVKDY